LQTLALVSKQFRILSSDPILWKYILTERNSNQVNAQLSKMGRPDRMHLVHTNILRASSSKAVLRRNINDGRYVSGPFAATSYHMSELIKQIQQKRVLGRHLQTRPSIDELRNLVTSATISPNLHAIILQLTREFKRIRIEQFLSNRKQVHQLPSSIAGIFTF